MDLMPHKPAPWRYPQRALLVVCGLVLGLATCEIALRLSGASSPRPHLRNRVYFTEPDPLLGWRNRRNVSGPYGGDEFLTRVSLNEAGRRDPPRRGTARLHPLQVAILGDSQAFGDGVEDDQTFAALLDGPGIEVRNHAVLGYGTDQELLAFECDSRTDRPEVVVVAAYLGNDLRDNTSVGGWQYPKPRFVLDESTGLRLEGSPAQRPPFVTPAIELFRAVMRHSRLLNALAEASATSEIPPRRDRNWWIVANRPIPAAWAKSPTPVTKEALLVTGRLLVRLVERIEACGARAIVVLIPELMAVEIARDPVWQRELAASGTVWRRPQDHLQEKLLGHARKSGSRSSSPSPIPSAEATDSSSVAQTGKLIVIDPLPALAAGKQPFYPGWKHLTAEGHRILADAIAGHLGIADTPHHDGSRQTDGTLRRDERGQGGLEATPNPGGQLDPARPDQATGTAMRPLEADRP